MQLVMELASAFIQGWHQAAQCKLSQCIQEDRAARQPLTEHQLDTMLAETFPASDPVTMY